MKSFTRACLMLSAITISVGLILTMIGGIFGAGSAFAHMVRDGKFQINFRNSVNTIDGSLYDEFDDIQEISIDLNYAELNIVPTDDDTFQVRAENALEGYKCFIDNGKLIIKDNKNNWGIGIVNNTYPSIELSIPRNINLDKITIEVGAGEVYASELLTDKLNIGIGAGKFDADDIKAKKTWMDVGAGSLAIHQLETDYIDMSCGTGRLEVNGVLNGDAKMDCGLGNIAFSVEGSETQFNYDVDCGIGNVIIGRQSISGIDADKAINNDAEKKMDIECGVGNIEITFNETL